MSLIANKIAKVVGSPPNAILTDINLEIKTGEFVALTGKSGSGKSSLLYILGSLDDPSSGHVQIEGHEFSRMKVSDLNQFRNEKMGFVFQFHYLLSELTAIENVLMPAKKSGREKERRSYGQALLDQFGLSDKMHRLPRQMSGGEQQRVAIARALVMQPTYLFADEPTGALDSTSGDIVMKIIREANEKMKATIIMVTHDPDFAALASRQVHLADGRIVNQTKTTD